MNFKENETTTKLRGGYYTPPEIAQFLLKWVLTASPQKILEPSCGDGVFIQALKKLDASSVESFTGFEIDPQEAAKAQAVGNSTANNVDIIPRDFLKWALLQFLSPPQFDAIVGNPPFIRYQYLDKDSQAVAQTIFKHFHLKFSRHTNAWVSFIIASLALLKPSGRIALVVPSELLHILYADSLRSYLAKTCSRILLFDPQELWFENTLQGALLLLAEKKNNPKEKSRGISIIPTKSKDFLNNNPEDYFQKANYTNGETVQGKWMTAFLNKGEYDLLQEARRNSKIYTFDDVADVAVGIVTGANKYFLVPDKVVKQYKLSEWAYPMFGRSNHVPGIIYDESVKRKNQSSGLPTNFLWFDDRKFKEFPKNAQKYIEFGEQQNLHTRYKCRIRSPWYSVPSVYSTSAGMLKRCHDFPRVIFNKIEAYTTDTAYRITTKKFDAPSLAYSFVNSLTALTAELEGRHYGGGVLELVPSEIRKVLIPLTRANEKKVYNLDSDIRNGLPSDKILVQQDKILLKETGFSKQQIEEIHHAWLKLRARRQRRDHTTKTKSI